MIAASKNKIIKDGAVESDRWILVEDEPLGENSIVPLHLLTNSSRAIVLDSHQTIEEISIDLDKLELIAINFPAFTDGRGYSLARRLRCEFNFNAELRAVGEVLLDQLFYLQRCGFNSFKLSNDADYDKALKHLNPFSQVYQQASDNKKSILEQRLRT